jgi:hypothetical protein
MIESKRVKTGGRKKGSKNIVTNEIRQKLKDLVFNEINEIESYINQLQPKERIESLIKIIPYVLPKVADIQYYDTDDLNPEITSIINNLFK